MKEEEDNIAQFFKNHLAEKEFEFDESQWETLEKGLDNMDDAAPFPFFENLNWNGKLSDIRSVLLVIALGGLLFFIGWYIIERSISENHITSTEVVNSIESTTKESESNKVIENNIAEKGNEKSIDSNDEGNNSVTNRDEETAGIVNSTKSKTKEIDPINSNLEDETDITKNDDGEKNLSNLQLTEETNVFEDEQKVDENNISVEEVDTLKREESIRNISSQNPSVPFNNLAKETENYEIDSIYTNNTISNISQLNNKEGELNQLIISLKDFQLDSIEVKPMGIVNLVEDEDYEERLLPAIRDKRWALALFVAPDFNSASFSELYSRLSQAVGVQIEYYPSARVKIGLGTILNNKIYSATGEDYTPPRAYYWKGGIAPTYTDARCLTLDIPINVGYSLFKNSRRSIWLNAGFSSYWMLTENYKFEYDTYIEGQVEGWEGKRENFHLMGSLNLSVTYEHYLNNHFSLIVDPYFKTPIRGVGQGSIYLLSSGVNVGLKYRFGQNVNKQSGKSSRSLH
ncbi:MAG: hypothetical protein CMO01_12735 [Thalassobius sp.]|nr:hypothetical protein [Thalassovita sp.]